MSDGYDTFKGATSQDRVQDELYRIRAETILLREELHRVYGLLRRHLEPGAVERDADFDKNRESTY